MADEKQKTAAAEKAPKKAAKPKNCGHVNKHFYGEYSKQVDLPCILEPGHEGNHMALFDYKQEAAKSILVPEDLLDFKVVEEDVSEIVNGQRVMRVVQFYTGKAEAFWNDQAGIPADQITPANPGVELIDAGLTSLGETPIEQRLAQLEAELKELKG